jgi:predicted dehydrogenase
MNTVNSLAVTLSFVSAFAFGGETLRAGIIGADTSHVPEFTKLFNAEKPDEKLAGIKVVACFPGGSLDIPSSKDRLAGFVEKLTMMNVEIVDSIDTLLTKVDVVLLESVDGRPHLQQALPVLKAKKPLFIDKPLAGSLVDAVEIYRVAQELGVPVFSSSSLRFNPDNAKLKDPAKVGDVLGCDAYGPCALEPHHPDLFWYGIHGVETLFTVMGTGCETVTRVQTADTDFVVGVWHGGRIGTFRGTRAGKHDYGATSFGTKGEATIAGFGGYQPLVEEVAHFFKTGKPPVSAAETLEIYAFMEAADESKREGGKPVSVVNVLERARGNNK